MTIYQRTLSGAIAIACRQLEDLDCSFDEAVGMSVLLGAEAVIKITIETGTLDVMHIMEAVRDIRKTEDYRDFTDEFAQEWMDQWKRENERKDNDA